MKEIHQKLLFQQKMTTLVTFFLLMTVTTLVTSEHLNENYAEGKDNVWKLWTVLLWLHYITICFCHYMLVWFCYYVICFVIILVFCRYVVCFCHDIYTQNNDKGTSYYHNMPYNKTCSSGVPYACMLQVKIISMGEIQI